MLDQLRLAFPAVAARWRPRQRFACRCADDLGAALVGELDDEPMAFHLAGRRLAVRGAEFEIGIVADDVIAGRIEGEDFVIAFRDGATLVGVLPGRCTIDIGGSDGVASLETDDAWSTIGADDALALLWSGPLFALGYGRELAEATARAERGLGDLPWQQAEQRLAGDCHVRAAPLDDD